MEKGLTKMEPLRRRRDYGEDGGRPQDYSDDELREMAKRVPMYQYQEGETILMRASVRRTVAKELVTAARELVDGASSMRTQQRRG